MTDSFSDEAKSQFATRRPWSPEPKACIFIAIALIVVGVVRIVATYRNTAQAFDEPCHVAAALELIDHHTYKLDPVHPPLARVAIGIPLYLVGERYPAMSALRSATADYNIVGNRILYDSGHYLRNLTLARSAMLPFFVALSCLVFLWARKEFGTTAGLVGLALFTTTPIILAFSGVAYTDMVAAATQFAALFIFTLWIEKPNTGLTVTLGVALGLALTAKLTSLIFLPGAAIGITACKWLRSAHSSETPINVHWRKLLTAVAIAFSLLWGAYGFSFGHVQQEFQLSASSMPSFQHFPQPISQLSKYLIVHNWLVPAPQLLHGFAEAWVLSKTNPSTYIFGLTRDSCWYFFIAGVFFKSPIPFLILAAAGLLLLLRRPQLNWTAYAPAAAIAAIFLVTLPVKYHAGMRHVLVIFPLLAVLAGGGASFILGNHKRMRAIMLTLPVLLGGWQVAESLRAQPDFLAYFNEFAGADPSHVMVTGCDLDCGQDIFRLADELRSRNISNFSLAVWSSADLHRMGLPDFNILRPDVPTDGWVAVSSRSQRMGDVLHEGFGPDAFTWLSRYRPVAQVGKTIKLYHIPPQAASK